jgi:SNF2 family DNA or RNA helicase
LGLPIPIINNPLISKPDETQKEIYKYIRDDLIGEIRKRKQTASFGLRLIRLRQAASNPSLLMTPVETDLIPLMFDEGEDYLQPIRGLINEYDKKHVATKFIDTINLINKLIDKKRKVLVWCEFIGSVQKLSALLEEKGIRYDLLTGSNSEYEVRKKVVDDFNDSKGELQVVIATPLAVGESISLHKACHDAIYFEVSYNAGLHLQSMDRIHRLGLDKSTETNYWYMQSDFPIEKNVLNNVREKEKKMRKIIESTDIPLISDYRELFDNPYEQIDLRQLMKVLNE